jgi:hypothetical protein
MRNRFAISAILLLSVAISGVAAAQTSTPRITITPSAEQKVITGSPKRFVGSVRVQVLFDPTDQAGLAVEQSPSSLARARPGTPTRSVKF